jgi:alcohol dehydrogenase class IV
MERPLLVTDPGLAALPMVAEALEACRAEGLGVALFSEVKGNPTGANVEAGIAAFKAGDHDGVIAFGGGSALDAGKTVALAARQSRPWWDFEDRGSNWKLAEEAAIAPILAVPTTAGTGSETGRAGVILDERDHIKKLTAATGMDALAHCLEAYCAPGFQPLCEGIAVEGMRLVKDWLPRAVHEGRDVEARAYMLAAASMGSTAFQKGLGAIHSLSHPVGALYDSHHGLTNAVFMPYVLQFNRPAIEGKTQRLAAWLGLGSPGFPAFLDWVLRFREELGIPHSLAELGVDDSRTEEIVAMALEDPTAPTNPVPLEAAPLRRLFEDALAGRLA